MSYAAAPALGESKHEEDVTRDVGHSVMPERYVAPGLHNLPNTTILHIDQTMRGGEALRGESAQFSGVRLPLHNQAKEEDANAYVFDGMPIVKRTKENETLITSSTNAQPDIQSIIQFMAAPPTPRPIEEGKSERWLRALAMVRHRPQTTDAETQTEGPYDATVTFFPLSNQVGMAWQGGSASKLLPLPPIPPSSAVLANLSSPQLVQPLAFPESMHNFPAVSDAQASEDPPIRRGRGRPPGSKKTNKLRSSHTPYLASGKVQEWISTKDTAQASEIRTEGGSLEPASMSSDEGVATMPDASTPVPPLAPSAGVSLQPMSFPAGPDGLMQPMDPAAFAAMMANLSASIKHEDGAGHTMTFPLAPGLFDLAPSSADAAASLASEAIMDDEGLISPMTNSGMLLEGGTRRLTPQGLREGNIGGGPNKVVSSRTCPLLGLPEGMQISRRMLAATFHLPIDEAADSLKIGVTVLKKLCRSQFDVPRWPYRKLFSLDHLIETVKNDARENPGYMETAAALLATLEDCRQRIYENPSYEIPLEIKKLRQANFKNEYKQRQKGDDVGSKPPSAKKVKPEHKRPVGRPRKVPRRQARDTPEPDQDQDHYQEPVGDSDKDSEETQDEGQE